MLLSSLIIVLAYTLASIIKTKSIPNSISAMVYSFSKPWQWLWTVWMWAVAFLACIPLIDILGEGLDVLGFISLALLVFIGAMPLVENSANRTHNILAIAAGVLTQVCVAIISPVWLLCWFPVVLIGLVYPDWFKKYSVLLAEIVCYMTMLGCMTIG